MKPSALAFSKLCLKRRSQRPDVCAVAMTSGATTLETTQLREASLRRMGYDAQQVIPPYYWRCGELEVERHYRMVAEAGDLPVVIYHNPALSKFNISPKFAGKLATIPGVVAFKEVLTDLQHLEALYDEVGGRADIYNTFRAMLAGPDARRRRRLYQYLRGACRGRVDEIVQGGRLARAEEIQRRLNRCFPRGGEETLGHLGTTKVTASVATGIEMGPARPPYMAPGNAAERIRKRLPLLNEII